MCTLLHVDIDNESCKQLCKFFAGIYNLLEIKMKWRCLHWYARYCLGLPKQFKNEYYVLHNKFNNNAIVDSKYTTFDRTVISKCYNNTSNILVLRSIVAHEHFSIGHKKNLTMKMWAQWIGINESLNKQLLWKS